MRNFFLRTKTRLCGSYSCELGTNSQINLIKMSQRLFFAIINYLFSHFIHSFFYKHKAYRSWNLGLTFSISQKLKDLSNIFIYQKNKLVLNKISSIKHSVPPPNFERGLLEKRVVTFFGGMGRGGGSQFYKKNKLKSEIFNDKKNL